MTLFHLIALLLALAATFGFINHRFIGLPTTIGIMLISLLFSLFLISLGQFGLQVQLDAQAILSLIDFDETVLHGMLGFLLFAGALHIDLSDLARQKWTIALLATIGMLTSAAIVGSLTWLLFQWLGAPIPFIWCLVFGSLISPTDPIAVLSILKLAKVPPALETKIAGESLFNDGVAVVVFLSLLGIATGGHNATVGDAVLLFAQEAFGGVIFGLGLGYVGYKALVEIDNYQLEVLITLAMVAAGYALAEGFHLSAPIAVVVAGLFVGNHGRLFAMSDTTRKHLDLFWELVDEILNALLFMLIGLEIILLQFTMPWLLAGLVAIGIVLFARVVSVSIPVAMMRLRRTLPPHTIKILTWGGLRGGISVALALSLPNVPEREPIIAITYVVVVFSIVVQGLTVGRLAKLARRAGEDPNAQLP